MPDKVTVTTRQSWSSRLADSIKSVVFGLFLFVAGFPLLFWNEGRAVGTARSLEEGAGIVASVSSDSVNPASDGKLVHVSAFTETDDVLTDETFGISENAVKLVRAVHMYQWVEKKSSTSETKLGGSKETTTTYEYEKEWSASLIDSSQFQSPGGHENPAAFPYEARTVQASNVSLGAFSLADAQIAQLGNDEALPVSELPQGLTEATLHDGSIYIGSDPANPAVGDTQIWFSVVRPGVVSVVAQQMGSSFAPYPAEAGGTVFLLEEAMVSADAMFAAAQRSNTLMTWVLRVVGFFVMFIGLAMIFQPIAVFGDVVPIVGRLLGAGVGFFSAFVAAFFSIVTIGIAWFAYRPVLTVALLVVAIGVVFLLARIAGKRAKAGGPPPLPVS